MNSVNKLLLLVAAGLSIHDACSSELKTPLRNAAYHATHDAKELSKATQKTVKRLQKRLAKAKKRYEKLLKKLIAQNISRADREKNKNVIILKRKIEHITNELDNLSKN